MPNRLIDAASPYLQQHAENPVRWYPWGAEALAAAKQQDKPIFLSIGYSACHWCHVMAHESFENAEIAAFLNQHFISIKVDREERPDLDQIYMLGVMAVSGGRGGWPLSAFLTPEQKFFFGGTYWPPKSRGGMPGFLDVLKRIEQVYTTQRRPTEQQASKLSEFIALRLSGQSDEAEAMDTIDTTVPISAALSNFSVDQRRDRYTQLLSEAVNQLINACDWQWGGFGDAPKFPHAMDLRLLLQLERRIDAATRRKKELSDDEFQAETLRQSVEVTLDRMAAGGIYDHIGGGFARYSVDAQWLVPHFEKMLYDNALLIPAYLDGMRRLNKPEYESVVRQSIAYLRRELRHPDGGFFSAQDADSEGEEGKFYVWTSEEVKQLLPGDLGTRFCTAFDITISGNFEGHNIPNRRKSIGVPLKEMGLSEEDLQIAITTLREHRARRIAPATDYKVLTSWNALAIDALAQAGQVLGDSEFLAMAEQAADFVRRELRRADGRLFHAWRDFCSTAAAAPSGASPVDAKAEPPAQKRAYIDGFLDDYAGMMVALLELHRATWNEGYIEWAIELAERVLEDFAAPQGGFYFTGKNHETLIARGLDLQDNSTPSGNSLAARGFWGLGRLCDRADFREAAISAIESAWKVASRAPLAAGHLLATVDHTLGPPRELVLLLPPGESVKHEWKKILGRLYLPIELLLVRQIDPNQAATAGKPSPIEMHFSGRHLVEQKPTLYVCENNTCAPPVVGLEAIEAYLKKYAT